MKLALGTVQFGLAYGVANTHGRVNADAAGAIIELARANNIDILDTAVAYGQSEECLGRLGTEGFDVVTKLPEVPEGTTDVAGWAYEQVEASLARLNLSSVYGVLLHRPSQLHGPHGGSIARALDQIKIAGLAQKTGVSIYRPNELEALSELISLDLVQSPFNIIDQSLHSSGWLDKLTGMGTEVHVRSVFLQGLLLMARADVPAKFDAWSPLWDQWHAWLAENKVGAAQACIGFVQSFSGIAKAVVGVDTKEQLQQLIAVADIPCKARFPEIASQDERLINPSLWTEL